MSSAVEKFIDAKVNEDARYLQYGFMAFMILIFVKLLTESQAAKKNRQITKNKMLLEATKMKLMAKMSMASAARGGGGGGWNK